MKKVLAIAVLAFTFTSCDSSTSEVTETNSDTTNTETMNAASDRASEIKDSTAMLDKMLADSNSTMTPDSLK